jgi:hypothetical protein
MADLLRMDYINNLPQPFMVRFLGGHHEWEVCDIEVETGLLRIDVMGKMEVKRFEDVSYFVDMDGIKHDAETFYTDYIA